MSGLEVDNDILTVEKLIQKAVMRIRSCQNMKYYTKCILFASTLISQIR